MSETNTVLSTKGIIIVATSGLFYLYMFYLRVMPAVLTHELMRDFSIGGTGVSLLVGCFVFSYALIQIPSGLMIDRYGTRYMMTAGMLICAVATWLFQASSSTHLAATSRLLLGIASGTAFIAPLSLAHQWLPSRLFSPVAGFVQMLGSLGAIFSGPPVAYLAYTIGWRDTLALSALGALLLALIFYTVIEDKPLKSTQSPTQSVRKSLYQILSNPTYWKIAAIALASWAPIGVFAELWGIPYLKELQGFTDNSASGQIIWVWIGVGVFSPLAAIWSETIKSRKIPLIVFYSAGLISTLLLLSDSIHGYWTISFLLFLVGSTAGAQPIAFGLIHDITETKILATAVGFCNICVIAGAFLLQPIVGNLLDWSWDGMLIDGAPYYQLIDFQTAFVSILFFVFLGLACALTLKPTMK